MPYALKDICDTGGLPTEWGSATQAGRTPKRDCAIAAKLRELGCILMGKSHTTAFAYYDTGPTRNPRDLDRTPGGSSSGSAAAVAAGMVPLAIGSQTQGSVLRPASFCGVAGFKPSFGLLSLDGVMPFAPTLDHAGLFTATAQDLPVAWRALGFDTASPPSTALLALDWPPGGGVVPAMATAFEATLKRLAQSGIPVDRARPPSFFSALPGDLHTVMAYEAALEHKQRYRAHGRAIGAKLAELLDEGLRIGRREYQAARKGLDSARREFEAWLESRAVVATPAALGPAPRGLGSSGDPRCNAPFTALGAPAVSIPMPVPDGGLPLGLQLAAAWGSDALVLVTAARCEGQLGIETRGLRRMVAS